MDKKQSLRGDARWWLLGVMAISILGWLWLAPSAPDVSSSDSQAHTNTSDRIAKAADGGAETPRRTTPDSLKPNKELGALGPTLPLDTSVGTVTPFGPVVVRTNRFEPSVPISVSDTNASFRGELGSIATSASEVFRAQLVMARMGISSGSIDGKLGGQTRAAIRALQGREGLPITGALDAATLNALTPSYPLLKAYVITSDDLSRLLPIPTTWLAKSQLPRLDYESVLELVAEKFHSHPSFIQQLNPQIDWHRVVEDTTATVPNAEGVEASKRPSSIHISLSGKTLQLFDDEMHLLLHFPCSIARDKEKRPVGDLKVEKIAPNPNYTFNPDVFPESEEARQIAKKLIIQPGPNNPVGVAWISLDRPGYGIHGTPQPEQVGRTESHGCFRLANWNAELLVKLVWIGLPVQVEP
jgi:lipoprotein-anchoring transpeptidase ErfK/SrfK